MPALLSAALILGLVQAPIADRTRAEQLARAGRTADAIRLFEHLVEQNPSDTEARLWIARLELRAGRVDRAEAGFRAVLREHPADVDARIGLASALLRTGAWADALSILRETEAGAGENADLFATLARAWRRAGDDRRALEYYRRAKTLAPDDPDTISGFEATARAYGHAVAFEGFVERGDSDAGYGSVDLTLRVNPRVHLDASARVQRRAGVSDAIGGGGVRWRAARATAVELYARAGPGNEVLPTADGAAGVVHYAGRLEIAAGVRVLAFTTADVVAVSPRLAWQGDRWRIDGRYTYSRSAFDTTQTSNDHSVMVREAWRAWRRVTLLGTYAYGIESFEVLTADRLDSLGATTVAAGVRVAAPSHTQFEATWEHQWRSNHTRLNRFTLAITQTFP